MKQHLDSGGPTLIVKPCECAAPDCDLLVIGIVNPSLQELEGFLMAQAYFRKAEAEWFIGKLREVAAG